MDSSCDFWQAGNQAIAKGKLCVTFTHSMSPSDRKSSDSNESARQEVNTRIRDEGKGEDDSKKGKKTED